ncbi:MAG: NAD(P)H-binding protein [Pseudomonadota bacterium]
MTARIWLAGATGYIGRAVAAELSRRGFAVTVIVRPGYVAGRRGAADPALAGCRLLEADVSSPQALTSALAGEQADAVFSCLASRTGVADDAWRIDHRANSHLLSVAEQAGVRQFVLLSAICVQRPTLAFQEAKLAFERELMGSGLTWSIVRPTAFFKSLAGQVGRVRSGKPFLMFGDGEGTACKPISESDLAAYLVDCLLNPERQNRILPIGGPGPAITPRQQGELLCRLAGQPVQLRSVPVRLFDVVAAVLGPFGRISKRMAEKAELARIGRYYATESMLVWDEATQTYDADATPETGTDTLEAFYGRVLRDGLAGQELGAAKVF